MKKVISLLLMAVLCIGMFCGCGENARKSKAKEQQAKEQHVKESQKTDGIAGEKYFYSVQANLNCRVESYYKKDGKPYVKLMIICPDCASDFSLDIDLEHYEYDKDNKVYFKDDVDCNNSYCPARDKTKLSNSYIISYTVTRETK